MSEDKTQEDSWGFRDSGRKRGGGMQTALESPHSVLMLRFAHDPVSSGLGMVVMRKMNPGTVKKMNKVLF